MKLMNKALLNYKTSQCKLTPRTKVEHEKLIEMRNERKTAIKHHDHYLEKRGPHDSQFRTFPVPFDEKLRKKKKYKKVNNLLLLRSLAKLSIFRLPDFQILGSL